MLRAGLVAMGLSLCGHAASAEIEGQHDPRFLDALSGWLNDADDGAFSGFSRLARGGNSAARLLLSQIGATEAGGAAYLAQMAEENALAAALLDARRPETRHDAVRKLLRLGEIHKAHAALIDDVPTGRWDFFLDLSEDGVLPAHLRHYAWFAGLGAEDREVRRHYIRQAERAVKGGDGLGLMFLSMVPPEPGLAAPEVQLLVLGSLLRGAEAKMRRETDLVADITLARFVGTISAPGSYDEVRVPCERLCPEDAGMCLRAAFVALGGHDRIKSWGTPLQSLISSESYGRSTRAAVHLRADIREKGPDRGVAGLAQNNKCLDDLLND